uniref:type II toxin-antitoxin system TacA family antitoxin n=1 Tax=Klebsiella pneumoniae TaxID=573 RepID=UPI0039B8B0F1
MLYKGCLMKSDVQLNLRAKESQRALIDAAAEILHKSRTDFILEMACQAAENVILDRRVFNFNDEQYAEFIEGSSQKTESMVTPVFATPILTTSWLA